MALTFSHSRSTSISSPGYWSGLPCLSGPSGAYKHDLVWERTNAGRVAARARNEADHRPPPLLTRRTERSRVAQHYAEGSLPKHALPHVRTTRFCIGIVPCVTEPPL